MATTLTKVADHDDIKIFKWEGLTGDERGDALNLREFNQVPADITIQMSGDEDGAVVTFEGSIDGAAYAALDDKDGNAISVDDTSTNPIFSISPVVSYLQPAITDVGTPDVDIFIQLNFDRSKK